MSPQIGTGATNSPGYWDMIYDQHAYPTLDQPNRDRYLALARLQIGDSALDVGCGQCGLGHVLFEQYPRLHYVGVDYSQEALRSHTLPADCRGAYRLYHADWQDMGRALRGQRFDTVYLAEILEHVVDPARLLKVAARFARQRLVLSVPRYQALRWEEHRGEHAWDFSEEEMIALLAPYGQVGPMLPANHLCYVVAVDRE